MEYQLLKPEVIAKLLDLRLSKEETNQFAGEAQEMEDDKFDEKKNASKPKKCYLLVTEICFYYVTKESLRIGKGNEIISLFDIGDVILGQNDCITIKFKKKTFYFMLANAAALMTNILLQVKKLAWNITPGQIYSFKEISANQNYQKIPSITKRPPNLLLFRYMSTCVAREASFDKYIIETYRKYDEDPRVVLNLADIDPSLPLAAMFPVTLESHIRKISLEKFSSNDLGHTLNWAISQQNNFDSVDLCKYDEASFKGLNIRKSPFNHLNSIRFKSCTSNFVTLFLNSIKNVNYTIDTIIFDDIRFDNDTSQLLVQCLQTYTFFTSLRSLAFVGCQCASSSFFDLSISCLKALDQLDNFSLDNCFIDINDVLMEIAKCDTPVQHVSLRRNTSTSVIGHEDTLLTNSILSLNVGDSEWTEEALVSFMSAICRRLRRLPLTLIMDHCRVDSTWSEVFERFPTESLLPVITELNISNNYFDVRSFESFLTFLETQTPFQLQSNKKLIHLNVSHCFSEKISSPKKKKQANQKDLYDSNSEECISRLIDFFSKRDLWGLEICGCLPKKELININGLHALNIGDNVFDRASIETLENFVSVSPTLTELGIDNIQFPDVKTMMQFYGQMLTYSKILAFEPLNSLFNDYPEYNETKHFKAFLNNKRKMSNPRQRMSLYLTLAEDFATHVAQDIRYNEEDESVAEICTQSNLLCETQFSDPVPSLFTLATLNTVDLSVDPVASMVAEYAATSGKYGIVPPTNAPPLPPTEMFMIPSIFSTNVAPDEYENIVNGGEGGSVIDFDPKSKQNVEISKLFADEIKSSFLRNIVGFTELSEYENYNISKKNRSLSRSKLAASTSSISITKKRSPRRKTNSKHFCAFRPMRNPNLSFRNNVIIETDTEIDEDPDSSISSDFDDEFEDSVTNSQRSSQFNRSESPDPGSAPRGRIKTRVKKRIRSSQQIGVHSASQDISNESSSKISSSKSGNILISKKDIKDPRKSGSPLIKTESFSSHGSGSSASNPFSPSSNDYEEIEKRKNQKKAQKKK